MKIFQLYRKYWAVVGVVKLQPFEKNHSMVTFLKRLMVFIVSTVALMLSLIFIGYEADAIDEYADSFFISASLITATIPFIIILWKTDSLFILFENFENFIEQQTENPESHSTYVELNENIEKWTGAFYSSIVVAIPAIFMPNFILSFYLYFATNLDEEAFSLPFPIWTPFNWRTPIGYLLALTIEFLALFTTTLIGITFIGNLVASCYIVLNFCKEIKSDIRALDESTKAGKTLAALMKRVANVVKFHAITKQLVSDVDNIFALIIIICFLWGLSTICSTLLVVQMKLELNVNPLELVRPIFLAIWSFALLFMICEFGQMLTNHFDQLGDDIDGCEWTSFPKEIQKILPIIIQNCQRPVVLRTFENASCSRETFKRVTNGGFSYFMIFREFC